MKWPSYITFVRHDISAYNQLKINRAVSADYQEFLANFENEPESKKTRILAEEMKTIYSLKVGDHNTPLANKGVQAKEVGTNLKKELELPDVIFVSPYLRTKETLAKLIEGWPELSNVRVVEEERIREQEHGLATLCNDWKVFYTLYPEQKRLHSLEGDYWYRWPQGESVPDVRLRIKSWFDTLVRDYSGQKVLVVTHHLTILSLRANLERLGEAGFIDLNENDKPINVGVTLYRGDHTQGKDGKLILDYYNKKFY